MSDKIIIVERIFNAATKDVWRAITEKELMKRWYFDLAEFKAIVGFKFEFTGGHEDGIQYKHLCEITEVIPEKKLTYSWKYEGYSGVSFVTFELFDENEKTRLKLTHTGIETFPASNPDFAIHNFEEGWNQIINTLLKEFLEKKLNNMLAFDFIINKENKTISVKREFAANLNLVWDAWTKPELLDLWWAPKPYRTKTKSMDFREGGSWLYAMVSPEGETHWCKADYKKINVLKMFSLLDAFCDEHGTINKEIFPGSNWTNTFDENGSTTTVTINIRYREFADLEKVIQLGFKEGFTMALSNLDQFFEEQLKYSDDFTKSL